MSNMLARNRVMALQRVIEDIPGAIFGKAEGNKEIPVRHHFANGVYCRQTFIPQGYVAVGKIHRYETNNILMSGEVLVVNVDSNERKKYKAPNIWFSQGGSKRAVYGIEDSIWVTTHPVDKSYTVDDLDKIEEEVIVSDFETFDRELLQ